MADPQDFSDPAKMARADVAERYGAIISAMVDKELVNELEQRALMASYGYQDPITAMMLKAIKVELLRRLKGGEGPSVSPEPKAKEPAAPRATLFS